jgi:GGDEF domain-containing protein
MSHAILPLHRILQALDRRSTLDGHSVQLSASIGVALYPAHGEQAEVLLQRAHVAMFNARRMHIDHSFYEPAAAQATGQSA